MGCGRVGTLLAESLSDLGNSVAVVDQNPSAFHRLPATFAGTTVTGIGFDRETLEQAGVARAEAFAAVSSGDNSNILAARVARETYGVNRVVARIYDPRRAEVYQRLGISTIATVAWTTGQILRGILPLGAQEEYRDPSGAMALAEVHVGSSWAGHRATSLEEAADARVAFITRFGSALLPNPETVIQAGDVVRAIYLAADREHVEKIFETRPEDLS